jgi:tyrosine-protein kinase Etk/Wzc
MSDKFSQTDRPIDGYKSGQGTAELDLGELIYTLIDNKVLITITTLIALFLGCAKAVLDTPIYRADAMLQIQEPSQPLGALEPMAGLFESKVPVEAEIEIIKSRRILGETVKNLKMEILVKPAYFPVIGKTMARRFQAGNKNNEISSPLFGFSYSKYAWGGEKVQIDTFNVPLSWIDRKFT